MTRGGERDRHGRSLNERTCKNERTISKGEIQEHDRSVRRRTSVRDSRSGSSSSRPVAYTERASDNRQRDREGRSSASFRDGHGSSERYHSSRDSDRYGGKSRGSAHVRDFKGRDSSKGRGLRREASSRDTVSRDSSVHGSLEGAAHLVSTHSPTWIPDKAGGRRAFDFPKTKNCAPSGLGRNREPSGHGDSMARTRDANASVDRDSSHDDHRQRHHPTSPSTVDGAEGSRSRFAKSEAEHTRSRFDTNRRGDGERRRGESSTSESRSRSRSRSRTRGRMDSRPMSPTASSRTPSRSGRRDSSRRRELSRSRYVLLCSASFFSLGGACAPEATCVDGGLVRHDGGPVCVVFKLTLTQTCRSRA